MKQKVILFKSKPEGTPTTDNFEFVEKDLPQLGSNQVLLKTLYLSVDPYMRGKMAGTSSYTRPFKLNEPLYGDGLAEVMESSSSKFKKGDFVVSGEMPWSDYSVVNDKLLEPKPDVEDEVAMSCCGMTGKTAYIGLQYIGEPKQGYTCVVSGAAGAVGGMVAQILKIKGCNVIGIAGGKEKVDAANSLGIDDTIDYKSEDLEKALREKCPNGINLYWDNVGGETLDAVYKNMATFGRIINCGAISQYNIQKIPLGPRNELFMVDKRIRSEGFIVYDWQEKSEEAIEQMTKWYKEGKLKKRVTVQNGLEKVPSAFIDLFHGKNLGKMLVKI